MTHPPTATSTRGMITVQEAADLLSCHHTTVRRLIRQGDLQAYVLAADRTTRHVDRRQVRRVA